MDEPTKLLLAGFGAILAGILAWVLPYRWNLFRLKRILADRFSEKVNHSVPKVIGSILMVLGIVLIVGYFSTK